MRAVVLESALVAGLVAAPLLPAPWSALAVLLLSLVWLAVRRFRDLSVAVPVVLGLAVVALLGSWLTGPGKRASEAAWAREVRQDYRQLWERLEEEAARGVEVLGAPPQGNWDNLRDLNSRRAAFRRLARVEVEEGHGRRALLLLDPDGDAVAWAGEGLLHELPDEVPRSGRHYRGGFSAVTLLAVRPLDDTRRPWRVVAGASFSTDTLPFPGHRRGAYWSLIDSGTERTGATPGASIITLAGTPALVVERPGAGVEMPGRPLGDRLAWAAIGLALIWLAVVRGLRIVLPGGQPAAESSPRAVTPLALGGLLAVGAALSVPLYALAALVAGLGITALGLRWRSSGGDPVPVPVKGLVAMALLFLAAWGFLQLYGPLGIDEGIVVSPHSFTLRLAFCSAAFGLLCLAGHRRGAPPAPLRDRWAWGSVLLLVAGAAFCDQPLAGLALLGLGGAAAAVYASQRRLGEGMALVALVLMSILAAAGAWETAYRLRLRGFAEGELLTRFSPPSPREAAVLNHEIRDHFRELDLAEIVPRSPAFLERQDLAYALWRDSPLARPNALSALVVEPNEGLQSSFSFGIPINEAEVGDTRRLPTPWQDVDLPLWEDTRVFGRVEILFAGRPWGEARFWLEPRPGFELTKEERLDEVEAGLLRGAPTEAQVDNVSGQVLYGLYARNGRAALSPWEEGPPLPADLRGSRQGARTSAVVRTPSGRARAWARAAPSGWAVVYLPVLKPLQALERTGRFAVGVLLLLTLATPPVLLLALPRAAFRDLLWRAVRSYSKRLMIVYTVLLLVPLLLLNVVLVRVMEDRLRREQRAAGEAALASAQRILGERILDLPLGFGVDRGIGDEWLVDLSAIVRHDVNLYWGSGIYASSRHELFTAGLLPKRIPGEIFSRLALLGFGFSSRYNRVGGTTYLEVYAPLRVPGVGSGQEEGKFVLSVPLLAQQEEAARELWQLRGRGFLVTTALFLLLVAVGRRLARNFTHPLMQLVEGTRRIAAGAPSLDLAPTELELAALVEAVDEMARRIAEGREKLLREKQVVERMVDNITSGVVSLDRERRVLLHNRVAAELLGTEVGESLERVVERSERLAPVAAFLRATDSEMARETVRLKSEDGTEREWALVWVPLPGAGEPAALLVVEDATEVLRGQRLLAWAEMARMIAHEIKNPLTPIRLSAEHMREVYRQDPGHFDRVFERCTTNILTQVEELRSIASDFSTYSSIPRIEPKPADLVASMADLVEGYRAAPPDGVAIELETGVESIPTRFDAKLLHRAVRNLIENALRASAGGGRVVVRVEHEDSTARVTVLDSGPGVDPDNLQRIFDPYFSTHDTGTGLGLPIARRIAEEHGGDITARNRPEGGLEVVVTLPT